MTGSTTGEGNRSKVDRLLEKYELSGLGTDLKEYWTAKEEDRLSLRELSAYFNQRLLEQRMRSVGIQSLDGEVENIYCLLTDDDVSRADQTRAKRRLERAGVDVEELLGDFVSYQAVRTYLKDVQCVEYPGTETDPVESSEKLIRQLHNRTRTITESKIHRLRDADHLDLDEFHVLVNIHVICEFCGTQYDVGELLQNGGCDCGNA